MDEVHGKEIDLQKTTIKIPGANKPRIGKSLLNLDANKLNSEINSLNLNTNGSHSVSNGPNGPSSTNIQQGQSVSSSSATLSDLKNAYSDDMVNSNHLSQPGWRLKLNFILF